MWFEETVRRMLAAALGLATLSGVLVFGGCGQRQQALPPPVPEVAVVTVRPRTLVLTSELPGRTSSFRVAEIRPQVSGLVLERLFKEGDNVQAGQLLYRIDPAPFQAALENAQAALGRAEANLPAIRSRAERFRDLAADNAVSRQDYDDAAAALAQAEADVAFWKASVEAARINLAYTRVAAPISGRIGRSNVTEGAIVTAYQPMPLATIQQLDPIYVDVPQSTAELLRLKARLRQGRLHGKGAADRRAGLFLEDGTAYPFEGTLQFRDVTVDPTTGSVTLRILFPNPGGILLPGMFVRAVVTEGVSERAILLPQQAVSRDHKGNPFVLVVTPQDRVEVREIAVDRAVGNEWLVSSGLVKGDRVIVEGVQRVRPGMPVKVVPLAEGDTGPAPGGAGPAPRKAK